MGAVSAPNADTSNSRWPSRKLENARKTATAARSEKPARCRVSRNVSIHRRLRSGGCSHGAAGGRVAINGNTWGCRNARRRTAWAKVLQIFLPPHHGGADVYVGLGVGQELFDEGVDDRVEQLVAVAEGAA